MSDLVNIHLTPSAPNRRQLLQAIAAAAVAQGLSQADAQHVHEMAADEKKSSGTYTPKALNAHEFATLERLAELIIPADSHGPSAKETGTGAFIDLLCSQSGQMLDIYTGGFAWIDARMQTLHAKSFLDATPQQQTALLDQIAYRKTAIYDETLSPGIQFFSWIRKMVVDGYYTSPEGYRDVGYLGNKGMTVFQVPQEAIDYALRRSPAPSPA